MTVPTLVVTPAELDGGEIRLDGDGYHHLFRVRRISAGAELRLVDGAGRARAGIVTTVTRRDALIRTGEPVAANEPPHRIELVVGALKRERASWLVEKATELGAGAVRFVASERAPRRFGAGTFERLERVARSAVEQCGRARLPDLSGVHAWSEVPDLLDAVGAAWLLDPAGPPGLELAAGPGALVVGPEGGWTHGEREALAALGCRPVGLGARVLRVETAAIAGLALLVGGGG